MAVSTGALEDLDRLVHHLAQTASAAGTIPTDAWRDEEALYLQFDLPGMDRSSIEVSTERDTLTLAAERPSPIPAEARPLLTERPTGRFTRRLTLSDALDTAAAEASYDNGVLTLRIPLAAHVKPRKIAISGSTPRQLTA
ncbi:Hsp20/alpha crystallin family protein [Streptomyces sp. NPDC006622]|uniref:Hsp20/alpha crystallin family protein n=1 Tax=Streptomyces sp. NPDC006622 TaxID=3155459 RepID=UPI0033B301CB